jgi:cytoskeletal protein CcmA (bactofilin family)
MPSEPADTIIGANVEIKGSLHNHGPIQIHGKVIGDVVSDSLVIIGESAIITGPISAKQVDISGQVHGTVTADEQIELQPKSLVKGDLSTNRLSIKPGAVFIGKSIMKSTEINSSVEEDSENLSIKKRPRMEVE